MSSHQNPEHIRYVYKWTFNMYELWQNTRNDRFKFDPVVKYKALCPVLRPVVRNRVEHYTYDDISVHGMNLDQLPLYYLIGRNKKWSKFFLTVHWAIECSRLPNSRSNISIESQHWCRDSSDGVKSQMLRAVCVTLHIFFPDWKKCFGWHEMMSF